MPRCSIPPVRPPFGDDWNVISAAPGTISVTGTSGRDWIYGNAENNIVSAGAGDDVFWDFSTFGDGSGGGDDLLSGGDGSDSLLGGFGEDTIRGNGGDDCLWGGGDDDVLDGGSGQDFLQGEGGDDSLYGGDGGDVIEGDSRSTGPGSGADYIDGGARK